VTVISRNQQIGDVLSASIAGDKKQQAEAAEN
jgi:hypothetical protein